jgi:hypothetical protein
MNPKEAGASRTSFTQAGAWVKEENQKSLILVLKSIFYHL